MKRFPSPRCLLPPSKYDELGTEYGNRWAHYIAVAASIVQWTRMSQNCVVALTRCYRNHAKFRDPGDIWRRVDGSPFCDVAT